MFVSGTHCRLTVIGLQTPWVVQKLVVTSRLLTDPLMVTSGLLTEPLENTGTQVRHHRYTGTQVHHLACGLLYRRLQCRYITLYRSIGNLIGVVSSIHRQQVRVQHQNIFVTLPIIVRLNYVYCLLLNLTRFATPIRA